VFLLVQEVLAVLEALQQFQDHQQLMLEVVEEELVVEEYQVEQVEVV
jgi:hypothetical protein